MSSPQVADIEEKLDILIKAYMQDRERFYALPQVPENQQHSMHPKNPPSSGGGSAGGGAGAASSTAVTAGTLKVYTYLSEPPIIKYSSSNYNIIFVFAMCFRLHWEQPKPILVDTQFSEPSSPITKSFDQPAVQRRPPMHRGYSDLSNRIKKRVTLRYVFYI